MSYVEPLQLKARWALGSCPIDASIHTFQPETLLKTRCSVPKVTTRAGRAAAKSWHVMRWLAISPGVCALGSCNDGGDSLDACLTLLGKHGLGSLGATREVVQTCGDENPPLDFLAHPEWLPPGDTRRSLEGSPLSSRSSALLVLTDAFATLRRYAAAVWLLSVQCAHGHLSLAIGDGNDQHRLQDPECASHEAAQGVLRTRQVEFLRTLGALLEQVAAKSVDSPWVSRIGGPAQVIARHGFAGHHLDFASSVISGLQIMEPMEAVGMLHDLALRIAFSNCEMLAQLLAHFTLTELLDPTVAVASSPSFPRFEFHSGACCRRYHVLTDLISQLTSSTASTVRIVEIGVNNALTSEYLLARFPDIEFDGIDPYEEDREDIYLEAIARLARFGDRARLWRLRSETAASRFAPGSIDLVFVDGDHSREAVEADLRVWQSRVRPGGLLAGHDLFNPAFDGVLVALLAHLNVAEATDVSGKSVAEAPTIHFAPDYVWWLHM